MCQEFVLSTERMPMKADPLSVVGITFEECWPKILKYGRICITKQALSSLLEHTQDEAPQGNKNVV